jgi:hypothetical protein
MATKLVGQDGSPVKYQGKDVFSSDYSGVIKSVDMMKRTLIMTGTDETKDRDGDIIRLSGWNMDNYKKNPVFLWAHNYGSVPLARAEKVTKKKEPPRMEFLLQFPTKGIYPFADMILELYEEKIINASSVGFIPMKWNPIEEDNKDGHNRVQYGREYIGQELLELSGCAVPSNPSAVQNALKGKNFGFKNDDLLKYLTGATLIPRPEKEDDIIDELDKSETEIVDETTIQVQVAENLVFAKEEVCSQGPDGPKGEQGPQCPIGHQGVEGPPGADPSEEMKEDGIPKIEGQPEEIPKPKEELKVDFSAEISNINEEVRKIKEEMLISSQTFESMTAQIKGIQDSLAKALEDIQRTPKVVNGTSASILQDAFRQGKDKTDAPPTEKYSKESLDSLRLALVEVAKAMKNIKL